MGAAEVIDLVAGEEDQEVDMRVENKRLQGSFATGCHVGIAQ
jgi:hypothetical protein